MGSARVVNRYIFISYWNTRSSRGIPRRRAGSAAGTSAMRNSHSAVLVGSRQLRPWRDAIRGHAIERSLDSR
jgi:hypothetical protein